jgi:hypothetical protein
MANQEKMKEVREIKERLWQLHKENINDADGNIALVRAHDILLEILKEHDEIKGHPVDFPGQDKWKAMCRDMGEEKARRELVQALRRAADLVEEGGHGKWPDVFGCDIPKGKWFKEIIPWDTVSVTLSYPWPG